MDSATDWTILFKRAKQSNAQLAFSNNFFVSTESAEIEMAPLKSLSEGKNGLTFNFYFDSRSIFYSSLAKSSLISVMIYFPLTKEKFKFSGTPSFPSDSLQSKWDKLTNEEKLKFEWFSPDQPISEISDELNIYTAQEEKQYSSNFSVLQLTPTKVELTRSPPPQVVANSRKPDFESLMKLHKTTKKFVYVLSEDKWSFTQVNPYLP